MFAIKSLYFLFTIEFPWHSVGRLNLRECVTTETTALAYLELHWGRGAPLVALDSIGTHHVLHERL